MIKKMLPQSALLLLILSAILAVLRRGWRKPVGRQAGDPGD